MASPITSTSASNLIMATRDASASPASATANSTFSDVLERNMRNNDQAATRPREAAATPPRPTPAEQTRPAPTPGPSAKPAAQAPAPTPDSKAATDQAAAVAATQGKVEESAAAVAAAAVAATDSAASKIGTSSSQDDAPVPAVPAEVPDALLTGNPTPDPAENETAVAASLAALAPVLAGIALAPEPDASAPEADLTATSPPTPARTLASTLMARLFGHPAATTSGEGGKGVEGGADGSGAATTKLAAAPGTIGNAAAAADADADAVTDFAALLASKQPAATPAATTARMATEPGADPAVRLPTPPAPLLAAEPASTGLPHTAGTAGVGVARTESAPLQQLPVATPVGQRAWAEDVGTKLTWMVGRGESRAELVLTPPSMGKLGVSIHINGDQTTAHFVAATPAAREALEQAMPRLREMLQQSGINLGQTDVSTSGQHQAREDAATHRSPYPHGGASAASRDDAPLPLASSAQWIRGGTGVIDTFA